MNNGKIDFTQSVKLYSLGCENCKSSFNFLIRFALKPPGNLVARILFLGGGAFLGKEELHKESGRKWDGKPRAIEAIANGIIRVVKYLRAK